MSGRVKDFFWEEICALYQGGDQEPDDLEMLRIDAELAKERYEGALEEKNHERSC